MADGSWQVKPAATAAAFGVVSAVATAAIVLWLKLYPDPQPGAAPVPPRQSSPAAVATADPAEPSASARPQAHAVRRTGRLVMAEGHGYDLDVAPGAADWGHSPSWGPGYDLGYTSWDKEVDEDAIVSHDHPRYAASLPASATGTRDECAAVPYGIPDTRAMGARILVGRLVCLHTTEDRYALLKVVEKTPTGVTLDVTVWE